MATSVDFVFNAFCSGTKIKIKELEHRKVTYFRCCSPDVPVFRYLCPTFTDKSHIRNKPSMTIRENR